jgi:Matrixin
VRGQEFDRPRTLRASPTGRVPQWVRDEDAGLPVRTESGRTWSPSPVRRRRPLLVRLLPAVVVLALTVGAVHLRGPGFLDGATVPEAGSPHPTPGVEAADEPLGVPISVPEGGGTHDFVALQQDGTGPVAYDPCRPIHYVMRPDNASIGGEELLHDAVARMSEVTGLRFIYDGLTDEQPSPDRESFQPERYGDRWAPVLVTWETEHENPDFLTDVIGFGGSTRMSLPGEPQVFVTGAVALDAAAFDQMIAVPGGAADARAVILHELGHLVGLDHVPDATQLMYPESNRVLDFAAGDLAGLVQLGRGECVPAL